VNVVQHEFEKQMYFKVTDKTPTIPILYLDVEWKNFIFSSKIGEGQIAITRDGGGRHTVPLHNDLGTSISFTWGPAMNNEGLSNLVAPTILKGVAVPSSFRKKLSAILKLNVAEVAAVLGFIGDSGDVLGNIVDKPKFPTDGSNSLGKVIELVLPYLLNGGEKENFDAKLAMYPFEGYKHFGTQNQWQKVLTELLKCNPFFASALTYNETNNTFHLTAYSDSNAGTGYYYDTMQTMLGEDRETMCNDRKINVTFDKDLNITGVQYFDVDAQKMVDAESNSNMDVKNRALPAGGEKAWDFYITGVLYNLLFYVQAIHSNIHILHYIMIMGLVDAADDSKNEGLKAFAGMYEPSIAVKYVEVGLLLINENGDAAMTGPDGIGGSWKTRVVMKEFIRTWGSIKTADEFKRKFLFKGLYETGATEKIIADSNICTEVNKHFNNIGGFAAGVVNGFKTVDATALNTMEKSLGKFMKGCGEGVSDIDSLDSWLQLMSITGIIHGSTLSYSRFGNMPSIIRWRKIDSENWDEFDKTLVSTAAATSTGVVEDHHVFTNEMVHGIVDAKFFKGAGKYDFAGMPQSVKVVLDQYEAKAETLKLNYEAEITQRADFLDFGWILTDHCTDTFDGKQHSIATYF